MVSASESYLCNPTKHCCNTDNINFTQGYASATKGRPNQFNSFFLPFVSVNVVYCLSDAGNIVMTKADMNPPIAGLHLGG